MLYPQNGDRIVAIDSVTSLHLMCMFCFIFNNSCQTSYLKIHRTYLRQIFKVGRTYQNVAIDNQSGISFSIPLATLPWQPVFVGFIHRTDGVDGRSRLAWRGPACNIYYIAAICRNQLIRSQ